MASLSGATSTTNVFRATSTTEDVLSGIDLRGKRISGDRRFGLPEEIDKAILSLAFDDSSYVAGSEYFVDGGIAQV